MKQETLDQFVPSASQPARRISPPARKSAAGKLNAVRVRVGELVLPTWLPAAPDKNPMFLEKRVYQGSSGKVYPLPFTDRIAEKPVDWKWKAVWIENEFLRVLVLPEIGGRIHAILDKTNGYDLIYNQPVIKPALVGLAGPWISGGIEFNWPQHHRPATFLPVNFEIEKHADGSKTIWCCDHDPMCRMKGLHGVCLHPGRAYVELKVRAYNRTPFVQTFLWWANVATRVHEAYQSFFPPDVSYVADHARRSMSEYPLAKGFYYGVNYGERGRKGIPPREVPGQFIPPHALDPASRDNTQHANGNNSPPSTISYQLNDLSFYANIPVPTSYMCMGSQEDFFGGYDNKSQAGIVHIADHHIAPGKKQWTWGNHEFGYAWDRNLTEPDARGEYAPYIELMAGVYTDNQPDFSFLQPGETKAWSQYWYPIQKIGPAKHANLDAAINLQRSTDLQIGQFQKPCSTEPIRRSALLRFGVSVTTRFASAKILLLARNRILFQITRDLSPAEPFVTQIKLRRGIVETDLHLRVITADGRELISYQPKPRTKGDAPSPATEPPAPRAIASTDELFITGLHLDQYRHATRCPAPYWFEALRRDPGDARCNNALGVWHLRRGEFAVAEKYFRRAIERLTQRNANPADGEAYYNLGLCLRFQLDSGARLWSKTQPRRVENTKLVGTDGSAAAGVAHTAALRLFDESCAALSKATWNQAWTAAGYHALAEMDCRRGEWQHALEHLNRSLRFNTDNTRARNLKVLVLRRLAKSPVAAEATGRKAGANDNPPPHVGGYEAQAASLLRETLALDPLDWWARHLNRETLTCDLQAHLDIAHDYARAGFYAEAIELLSDIASPKRGERFSLSTGVRASDTQKLPDQSWGAEPLVEYTLGWLREQLAGVPLWSKTQPQHAAISKRSGNGESAAADAAHTAALRHYRTAAALPPDYCFPARLEEIAILTAAMRANPRDARAPYYLGNLLYDRRRHEEAIQMWECSAKLDPKFSIVWRNLGIGYFNIRKQPAKARAAYDRAFRANPKDARLLFERDQLWKRMGEQPTRRLRELEKRLELVRQRDDLSVEICALYNQTGQHEKALALVSSRSFQPWEGGEGGPLGQWVRSNLMLGRCALAHGAAAKAREYFKAALTAPRNLGEARHLLANQSDVHYWLGCALAELGEAKSATEHWRVAANFKGDFQEMKVRVFSEMTYYAALSWKKLGQQSRAMKLLRDLLAHAQALQKSPAKIDYFATSLPTMLLFDDDLQRRQEVTAQFLQAQAQLGLGRRARARKLLSAVLKSDPSHALALDFTVSTRFTAQRAAPR